MKKETLIIELEDLHKECKFLITKYLHHPDMYDFSIKYKYFLKYIIPTNDFNKIIEYKSEIADLLEKLKYKIKKDIDNQLVWELI